MDYGDRRSQEEKCWGMEYCSCAGSIGNFLKGYTMTVTTLRPSKLVSKAFECGGRKEDVLLGGRRNGSGQLGMGCLESRQCTVIRWISLQQGVTPICNYTYLCRIQLQEKMRVTR